MKYLSYIIIIFCVCSCKEHNTGLELKKPCPLPYVFICESCNPLGSHFAYQTSPDGSKLLFGTTKILDLKTLKVSNIDVQSLLPKNIKYKGLSGEAFWCPYDNNRFAEICITYTDTVGDGKNFVNGYSLIIVNLLSNSCQLITPKILGSAGVTDNFGLLGWLPSSSVNYDNFLIGYNIINGEYQYGVYNINTQNLQNYEYSNLISYSYNGKYYFNGDYDYINQNFLKLTDRNYVDLFSKGSFSPSGKKLAISAKVINCAKDSARYDEVWIIDVEKFIQNPDSTPQIKIINIRDNFCMFTYQLQATFTSESTLAVTMFKDGDKYAYLYEIDLDGNLKRQLTFVP